MTVHLFATLDTKGFEAAFVRDRLIEQGIATTLIDCGCMGEPQVQADVSREEVFAAAGTTLATMRARLQIPRLRKVATMQASGRSVTIDVRPLHASATKSVWLGTMI